MAWLAGALSFIKFAFEIYKLIKGVPSDKREALQAKFLKEMEHVNWAALKGSKTGDYSQLEDYLSQ